MVYIKKINKHLLPYQLYPLYDELFSSWLCRLAFKSKVSINTFTSYYLNSGLSLWHSDIDQEISSEINRFLKDATLLNNEQISNMFLSSYNGVIFSASRYSKKYFHFLSHGQQFCPGCFKKSIPYFKKQWRLITSVVCSGCKCRLVEKCPECNSLINYQRANIEISRLKIKKRNPIYFCSSCDFDLRDTKAVKVNQPELEYQKYINHTLIYGYNEFTQYSFAYFFVLMLLAKNLRSNNNRLRGFQYEIDEVFDLNNSPTSNDIKYWNYSERKESLVLAYHLLKNNELFGKIISRTKVSKQTFKNGCKNLPYWFEKLFEDDLIVQ